MLQLIELYYENVSNASLLLHKASLHEAVDTGIAIPHVLLSICAFGAKYGFQLNFVDPIAKYKIAASTETVMPVRHSKRKVL